LHSLLPAFNLLLSFPSDGLKSSSLKCISQTLECTEGLKVPSKPQASIHFRQRSCFTGKLNWPTLVLEEKLSLVIFWQYSTENSHLALTGQLVTLHFFTMFLHHFIAALLQFLFLKIYIFRILMIRNVYIFAIGNFYFCNTQPIKALKV